MNLGLGNKRALVLGSTSGIGRGIAEALIAEGASVAISGRQQERAEAVAAEISAAAAVAIDLEEVGAGAAVIAAATDALGGVDVLITNAGGPPKGSFLSIDDAEWERGFRGLWMSAIDAIRSVLPQMIERGWGRIVMVTSSTGREPISGLTLSNAYRPGLHGLANSVSKEVACHGVTVNALMPGTIDTARLAELGIPTESLIDAIPAGRLGRVDEIGAVAAFLASEQAGYLTGQAIAVDGARMSGI